MLQGTEKIIRQHQNYHQCYHCILFNVSNMWPFRKIWFKPWKCDMKLKGCKGMGKYQQFILTFCFIWKILKKKLYFRTNWIISDNFWEKTILLDFLARKFPNIFFLIWRLPYLGLHTAGWLWSNSFEHDISMTLVNIHDSVSDNEQGQNLLRFNK